MSLGVNHHHHVGIYTSKENALASSNIEVPGVQKAKQRTVLGVLTENEQHGRTLLGGRHVKCSFYPDGSQDADVLGCQSGYDVYEEELPCDMLVPPAPTKEEEEEDEDEDDEEDEDDDDIDTTDSGVLDENDAALQHRDFRLFLDLSTNLPCTDTSMQSLPEEPLVPQDEFCVLEYTGDIYRHLREREMKLRPRPNYMSNHPEVTGSMRVVLVDWLAAVAEDYKLCTETLYLAASYLERFLSYTKSVKPAKLQLVGTVALMLAGKYEEIYPPRLEEFVSIMDGTYNQKLLIRMELLFLKVLTINLTVPTTYQFLRLFFTIQPFCSKTAYLALYVAELSLLELEMAIMFPPSVVAASAYCLANYTLSRDLWPDSLEVFTGYTMVELVPCLKDLHRIYFSAAGRPQQATRKKYKSSKYASVSRMTPPTSLPFP